MGILSRAAARVADIFSGTGTGAKLLQAVYQARIGDPPKRGTKEFLAVYQSSPWVRAVVGRISQSIGETQFLAETPDGKLISDHLMVRTLQKPNTIMTGSQLLAVAQQHIETVGDAFLLKERNGFGATIGLYPLPPHWIAEVPTPNKPYYRVQWGTAMDLIPSSEILWLKDMAPLDPYGRGSGVAMALGDEIGTDEYAAKHAQGLFFNRATPEFVVMDPGASPDELAIYEKKWLNRLQGFWKAFKPMFVNKKLEFWQPSSQNLENLTLVPLRKFERDVILQTWGMPPEQFGIVEDSNRATADVSDYVYEKRIVRPRRDFWRAYLQAFLAPEYDARLVVKYVDTVPADKQYSLDVGKAAPYALTMDEWRAMIGQKPVGGELGASRFVPLQGYLAVDPLDPASRPQAAAGGAPPSDKPKDPPEDPAAGAKLVAGVATAAFDAVRAYANQDRPQVDFHMTAPTINLAPQINVPEGAAPVVNVENHIPQQAAPVVPAPVVNVTLPQARARRRTVERNADGQVTAIMDGEA